MSGLAVGEPDGQVSGGTLLDESWYDRAGQTMRPEMGFGELVLILVIVVIVFGSIKLPRDPH
jgi:hypothetical protein